MQKIYIFFANLLKILDTKHLWDNEIADQCIWIETKISYFWTTKYVYSECNISPTLTKMMLSCCISNFNLNYKRTDVMVRDMYMIMWQLKYNITKIFFFYKFHFSFLVFSLYLLFSLSPWKILPSMQNLCVWTNTFLTTLDLKIET